MHTVDSTMSIHPYQEEREYERRFVRDNWDGQITFDDLDDERYVACRERFYDPEPRDLETFDELDEAIRYLESLETGELSF